MSNCVVAVSAGRMLCCVLIEAANTVAVGAACQDDAMPAWQLKKTSLW